MSKRTAVPTKKRYRATTTDAFGRLCGDLVYPIDQAWVDRLKAAAADGPDAAQAARDAAVAASAFKVVTPGDDCSDVPAESVPWLLEQGYIEEGIGRDADAGE